MLDGYFRGQANGEGAHYRAIFQPTAKLYWISGGKYAERTSDAFIAGARGRPADDEARRNRRQIRAFAEPLEMSRRYASRVRAQLG